jgi:hypothetical protein
MERYVNYRGCKILIRTVVRPGVVVIETTTRPFSDEALASWRKVGLSATRFGTEIEVQEAADTRDPSEIGLSMARGEADWILENYPATDR